MSYFSRLTDIVTCNLTELLRSESDPAGALERIVTEMQEGLAGARRSVATAASNVDRIRRETDELRPQIDLWAGRARQALGSGDEAGARQALLRKHEVEDLLAGLDQQHQAALSTQEHLTTMLRALEARLTEALRRQQELAAGTEHVLPAGRLTAAAGDRPSVVDERARQVDAELEALKRELDRG